MNIYLAKKNGSVIAHTDLEAMRELDGVNTPDMEVPEAEWYAAEGLARIIRGKIFLGKTDAEKQAETNHARIAEIDAVLEALDQRAGTGRAPRTLLLEYAESAGLGGNEVQKLREAEEAAQVLREERAALAG
jgi:hypothetical protein